MCTVKPKNSVLITDECQVNNAANRFVKRKVIGHKEQYVDGHVHANTIITRKDIRSCQEHVGETEFFIVCII